MNLLDYPIPELDVTLQEVGRVLQLTLSPELYLEYKTTLDQQRELLQEAQQRLACRAAGQENWVTDQFKKALLACSDPLPTSTALPLVMLPSKAKCCSQLSRAAAILWAAARLHAEPLLLEGSVAMERTQQSEAFSACRLPGPDHDQFKVYPDSLHAIITCTAGVFPVDILWRPSSGGPLCARTFPDIYSQLTQVQAQIPSTVPTNSGPLTVCSLSGLERKAWARVHQQIQNQGGTTTASLELMQSAVLTLSLEDSDAPTELADILNAVRLGGEHGPCLRYYDKVTNLVVFRDSTAGVLFEHTGVDGMVACLLTKGIYDLSETVDFNLVHSDAVNLNGSVAVNTVSSVPCPLALPLDGVMYPDLSRNRKTTFPILSFDLPIYPDALAALSAHRGLYDAWITFSLQLSLKQTLGDSASNHILVTPTHMRHYKHGRCDPTYSLTSHSRRLINALSLSVNSDQSVSCTADILRLFHVAFLEHKALIKSTKNGRGVGPHLAALRRSLPADNPLKRFFDPFSCPSVYLSGTLLDGVECIVGNVYAQNQLSVTYFGRKDKVRMMLNAKGTFTQTLVELKENLKMNLQAVMLIALRYAIASQMGALECLLLKGQTDKINGETCYSETSKFNQTNPSYTLLIHGGAGEEMLLNPSVIGVIEFALETALTVGAQVLQQGGKSVDAVQRSVEAMENCFLFNAGKGSVFNKDGGHELEASIVDGRSMKSGSVACVEHVKNPIKAARSVLEKCQHSFLVGRGAEEFWQKQDERDKPVDSEYYHTYLRQAQLSTVLGNDKHQKNNHPQTVGAVALDGRWGLAAATSTGGLVGKLKGRVGDTAVVGAGVYADETLAISCSGDGDVFLRQSVAQKIASLYQHKGYSLRHACREVIAEKLKGVCAGVIAVDRKGDTAIETNAGVMFVGSLINGVSRVEALMPIKSLSNIIWESDELVAYLHSSPWTPGATVLTRKTLSGAQSIFDLPLADYMLMLEAAKMVSHLLCQRLGVQRCALVFYPSPDHPAQIRLLPLHGLSPDWEPHLASEEEFHSYDPGFCTSKSAPQWDDAALSEVQAKIRSGLPTPNAPACFDFFGRPDPNNLFSRIIRGLQQQWRVWEDSEHVAFLTPFANSPGLTVVVPRKHLPSDIFRLENADYRALILATHKVAQLIQSGMQARGIAMIFEGLEIDYAHVKLIPLLLASDDKKTKETKLESFETYPGFVSSVNGPCSDLESLKVMHTRITQCIPPHSWQQPQSHATSAIMSDWYRSLFQIQNTLFHSTVEYFHHCCKYSYALTPLTTDTISSPMGLGSDSEPVSVNLLGHDVYLADSMQFVLEYFLRFQDELPGTYYVSPSFRGEDPDSTHLNQFYHVECELLGDMDSAISVAEEYVAHLTTAMLKKHSDIIIKMAGSTDHAESMLQKLKGKIPRITLDEAIPLMTSADCLEWVQDGQPQFGRKLTRKGEHLLMEKYGGAVWLTEMDHLAVPFYQAYVDGTSNAKAKAADLLIGLGETIGLGERHSTPTLVQEALKHHAVPEDSYRWYINMRQVKPLHTSGWGMGTERYLCWLLRHNDIRDMHIIPRMKGVKYMP